MRKAAKETVRVTDKIVQERIKLLEADPEFSDLWELLPKALIGKESGADFHGITTDREFVERTKDKKVIVLSKSDWDKYKRFQQLCSELGQRYGLYWATVEDLATEVRQPTVSPRQSRIITAGLDPIVFLPKGFDANIKYVAHPTVVPPLEAIEIMRRVQGLDEQAKEEIKAFLSSLFKDKYGCHIVELSEPAEPLEKQDDKVEFDVCLRVPVGYTAREVAEVYRKVDNKRREVSASLGVNVPKRRRQSKTLMEAKSLRLLEHHVSIYDIVDDKYPNFERESSQDQPRRRAIINQRHKGIKLLKKRRQR
jgi:hypothetical protein